MKTLLLGSLFLAVVPLFAACSSGDFAVGSDQSAQKGSPGVDGGACVVNDDCASGSFCGFANADACTATGRCFAYSGAECDAYSAGCACDGTNINVACTPYPTGYSSKPLLHAGACTGGGAQDAGVGGSCDTSADCTAPNESCAFLASEACSAHGVCVSTAQATCEAFSAGCACDGTVINVACTPYPQGYVSKPLAHSGDCSEDGGSFAIDAGH